MTTKKTENIRFADVKEVISELLAVSQKFGAFRLPEGDGDREGLRDKIERAIYLFVSGKEGEAVRVGQESERWLRNSLTAYYLKVTPRDINRRLQEAAEKYNLEQELAAHLGKKMRAYEDGCQAADRLRSVHMPIDLGMAAKAYVEMDVLVKTVRQLNNNIRLEKQRIQNEIRKRKEEENKAELERQNAKLRQQRESEVADLKAMLAKA